MRLLTAAACVSCAFAAQAGQNARLNPIRRVVNMLQIMAQKVESEGKKEQEMFDKYMCYCETGESDLKKSIDAAETKIPQLQSSIEEATAEKNKLKNEIERAKSDLEEATSSLESATSLRERDAQTFATQSAEDKANIEALGKAVVAVEKGMGSGFLQTKAATIIRSLTVSMDMSSSDRDLLSAFLSGGQSDSESETYAPQSGEIVGMLKQMKETMEKDLSDATSAEGKAKTDFESMSASKNEQIQALTRMIEAKTARSGEVGVDLVNLMDDLDDTSTGLEEDNKFLGAMEKDCKTKKDEWAVRQKMRTAELLAIADTIKLLNDDDALDLFKKTLASPTSFLQVRVSSKELKAEALSVIQAARRKHPSSHLDLVSLALRAKKTSFDKIIKMINDMVALLGKEQDDDDAKKAYCRKELDDSEDKLKVLTQDADDAAKAIDEAKEKSATLSEEIAALTQSIKDLDQQVAQATTTRKEEHADFVETLAANNAAKELLGIAKNRLNKFYNPDLYKAPAAIQVKEGSPAPTVGVTESLLDSINDAPAFMQTRSEDGSEDEEEEDADEEDPPPPPESVGEYKKQDGGNTGVVGLIDSIIQDLDAEISEMKTEEKQSQQAYEELVKDSTEKRAMNAKSITEKEGAKADLEERLHKMEIERKGLLKEASDTAEYLQSVHDECDWLLANFDVRKQARAGEVEALKKATAVLSGADYSFLQIAKHVQQ
jgi:predicted  nucleic acid-binding Zn-ribbon protein